jgi:hypothetical protein
VGGAGQMKWKEDKKGIYVVRQDSDRGYLLRDLSDTALNIPVK